MRIVIDMQGAQTESRYRGIGRYSLSLSLAIARNAENHEIYLALNGLFPESIVSIRRAFHGLIPQENIRVWQAPGPTRWVAEENTRRRAVAECVRKAFLQTLEPDVVVVTSLFEGLGDDAIASIDSMDDAPATAVILYDLIPLINPDIHFRTNPIYKAYYADRIENLNRATHLLAISESARQEALGALSFTPDRVTNVSGACDAMFTRMEPEEKWLQSLRERFGLSRQFIMYTGGADSRKNLPRLIEAFAELPDGLRQGYQLLFAGRMPAPEVEALQAHASTAGLQKNELIFTEYIDDRDLLALFSTCSLFVFPSLHEGFGLPPLEAMSCGAVVIAANSTSLPEVMNSAEAMFDPASVKSISEKMRQALTDEALRRRLLANAAVQSKAFSWDRSAQRALNALSVFHRQSDARKTSSLPMRRTTVFEPRIRRILVLKLDHMGDLLLAVPAIARLRARYPGASIDIVVGSWNLALASTLPFFDRVLTLDYFKRKSSEQADLAAKELDHFLAHLAPYDLAIDLRRPPDTRFVLARIPATIKAAYQSFDAAVDEQLDVMIRAEVDAPFVETSLNRTPISEQMLALVDALPAHPSDYVVLPALTQAPPRSDQAIALFPYAGGAVKEWPAVRYVELAKRLAETAKVERISVFFANETEAQRLSFEQLDKVTTYAGLSIPDLMKRLCDHRLCVANNSGGAHLAAYLGVPVLGIYGGHETAAEWAPVFGESYVDHRDAACSPCHIAKQEDCPHQFFCIEDIATEDVYTRCLEILNANGPIAIHQASSPIERAKEVQRELFESLAGLISPYGEVELTQLACDIAISLPRRTKRILFVDVSELVQHDARTGIQRVTRSVLRELLQAPPTGFEVWPIYATPGQVGFRFARHLRAQFLEIAEPAIGQDDPIDYQAGDVFLGLDLHPYGAKIQQPFLDSLHRQGVRILFVVYDLLCLQMPDCFVPGSDEHFEQWLQMISRYDGVVCGSRSVAEDFTHWLSGSETQPCASFEVGWFHYGADVRSSQPSRGMPDDAPDTLQALRRTRSFLMVGTIEPRKGHAQVLDAFEHLWRQGVDVNLVIVGKVGWMVEALRQRLLDHPQLGHKLFWLMGVSDEYLEQAYEASCCLIVASEGEGFGLPLIEAASKNLPVLARDLPVFREVANEHAHYFRADSGLELADAIERWLHLYEADAHPRSDAMPTLSWREAVQQLLKWVLPHSPITATKPALGSTEQTRAPDTLVDG